MFLAVSSVGALKIQTSGRQLPGAGAAGFNGFAKVDWAGQIKSSKFFESKAVHHKDDPNVDNLLQAVVTIPSNPYYRVSDVMCNKGHGVQTCIKHVLEDPEFNGTILQAYLQRRNKHGEGTGIALLRKIIDEGGWSASVAESTDIVVHIRAGDAMYEGSPLANVQKLMTDPQCKDAKRIVVVTAKAFQTCAPGEPCEDKHEQKEYGLTKKKLNQNDEQFRTIFGELSQLGLDVAVQSHMHVDQDLAFIASAKCLVRTSGGFSKSIMAPVVEMAGGVVEPHSKEASHCEF